MELDYAFLCDYAQNGPKVAAMGIGLDTIIAPQVPHIQPTFHLVAQLKTTVAEAGKKDLSVRLIDADGKDLIPPLQAAFDVPHPPEGMLIARGRFMFGFNGVHFPRYGECALHVVVQGREMARLPIRVIEPPKPRQRPKA